jgi:DNA-binding winged helix-turn-helix (wHTH) protein
VRYQFAGFTVDVPTRRLLWNDAEIHLSPKAFDLLVTLIENRTQAVSKAELQQRLWPKTYVLETNLAGLIAEIRQALQDEADNPRFIATKHRFGYRFIGEVEASAQDDPPAPSVKYWVVWDARQIPLAAGSNVIGRGPDASVWIEAAGVSRHHARIVVDGAEARLEDLGSKNGTYLRGEPVTAVTALADGDQIRIGSVLITFRIPPPAGSTETVGR